MIIISAWFVDLWCRFNFDGIFDDVFVGAFSEDTITFYGQTFREILRLIDPWYSYHSGLVLAINQQFYAIESIGDDRIRLRRV